jgi:A/G-specific adenine glycosylase
LHFAGAKSRARFSRALLTWYDRHRRDLPWRNTRDPYRVWLSEIMLQQTRVAAVLDHYHNFLERFPDLQTLAAAPEDAVLAAWSGLGYYRRARMLHRCARQLVNEMDGRFPQNSESLARLPGIGRYTAAAIGSIAFAEPAAVVDGNVERVLSRLAGTQLAVAETWQRAQELLPCSRPGDFNQAMMELGATVCLPRDPSCGACPVRKWCATQGENRGSRPRLVKRKQELWCTLERREDAAGHNQEVRLVRRPKKAALMPGMWELPQTSQPPQPLPDRAVWRTFRHSITLTDYRVHVLRGAPSPLDSNSTKGKWIAAARLRQIPITGLTRKILKAGSII